MTLRDLPKRGISDTTYSEPPIVSASTGSWTTGIDQLISGVTLAAMKELAGKTVSDEAIDVLEINGNQHVIEALDNNQA